MTTTKATAAPHPLTIALEGLAPVIGCSYQLTSFKGSWDDTNPANYPLIEYAPLLEPSASYDKSKNLWRTSLLVQINILMPESTVEQYCKDNDLQDAQDRHAFFNYLSGKIRNLITMMVNPQSIGGGLRKQDFIFYKYNFSLINWTQTLYFTEMGPNLNTGVSATIEIEYDDILDEYCCIRGNKEQLLCVLEKDSYSYNKVQGEI